MSSERKLAKQYKTDTPVGFGNWGHGGTVSRSTVDHDAKVVASAMNVAMAPAKSIPMTAFMLWMSGNNLQIFSIFMLGMAFVNPIKAIFALEEKFSRYADSGVKLTNPKLIYVAVNLAALGVAVYKANNLGLMPGLTDLYGEPPIKEAVQWSVGSVD